MAKDEQVNGGANYSALVKQVAETFKVYAQLENDRAQINAEMAEVRAKWERMGLSKKGIKAGLSRAKLDSELRDLFDESYALAADAKNLPLDFSPDFFDNPEIFNPAAADDVDPDTLPDGDRDPDDGPDVVTAHTSEQAEGDEALKAGMPKTTEAQGLAT